MAADSRRIQSDLLLRADRCPRRRRRPARARRPRYRARRAQLPMPKSSSSAAKVPGTGSPSMARWAMVREVEKPSAPAATASFTSCLHAPRCPRVWPARCGRRARPSRRRGRRRGRSGCRRRPSTCAVRRLSRYSGKVSHSHSIPSESAVPGMSSTPSISPISHSCRSGSAGCEADPAVTGHQGGHAVPAARGRAPRPRLPGRRSGCGCRPNPV